MERITGSEYADYLRQQVEIGPNDWYLTKNPLRQEDRAFGLDEARRVLEEGSAEDIAALLGDDPRLEPGPDCDGTASSHRSK